MRPFTRIGWFSLFAAGSAVAASFLTGFVGLSWGASVPWIWLFAIGGGIVGAYFLPRRMEPRERSDAVYNVFAVIGILVGLILFVVPGLYAIYVWDGWQRGRIRYPGLCWFLAWMGIGGFAFAMVSGPLGLAAGTDVSKSIALVASLACGALGTLGLARHYRLHAEREPQAREQQSDEGSDAGP